MTAAAAPRRSEEGGGGAGIPEPPTARELGAGVPPSVTGAPSDGCPTTVIGGGRSLGPASSVGALSREVRVEVRPVGRAASVGAASRTCCVSTKASAAVGCVAAGSEETPSVAVTGPIAEGDTRSPSAATLASSMASRMARAEGQRSSREKRSARSISATTGAGIEGATSARDRAGRVAARTMSSPEVSPSWTTWPESSANRVAPTLQTSERASTSRLRPRACSGGMKAGVPSAVPAPVRAPAPSCSGAARPRAMPKSSTLRTRPVVRKRFSGLTSRWTMPFSWAASSTSRRSLPSASTSRSGRCPPSRRARACSVSPSSSSITRNTAPSSPVSSSSTRTAPGWPMEFATYPSRRKRARVSGSAEASGCSTLTATRLPLRCTPRYTAAIPPAPSTRWSTYLSPSTAPTRRCARCSSEAMDGDMRTRGYQARASRGSAGSV